MLFIFDGLEDCNGKCNYDEIRFMVDYLLFDKVLYFYDDNGNKGGIV